jgi:hypothetical protein
VTTLAEPLQDASQSACPLDIGSAARAFLCRSGHAETELRRRLLLRDTLRSSRELAHALEAFLQRAGEHYRGVHCTSHLDTEVEALTRTLADWSESISATAALYHECHEATRLGGAAEYSPQSTGASHAREDDLAAASKAI